MAVEVRYLVVRGGKEVGMYTSKKEADAHDKMLDIAENLFAFMGKAEHIDLKENQLDELSIYLSHHREEVIKILKGSSPQATEPEMIPEMIEAEEKTATDIDEDQPVKMRRGKQRTE